MCSLVISPFSRDFLKLTINTCMHTLLTHCLVEHQYLFLMIAVAVVEVIIAIAVYIVNS